ncbi:MAG TPA: LytTR family transcriptional regulator DNA-binding domain-containing protein [Gemmatimonadales bacterium]|nr:LytTR family transcriptional regulator DNA-binding domain-containing protein [Gemmatimonadales bacterium]
MRPLRTLIVDDEALARDTLRRLLSGDGDVEVLGDCAGGEEAVRQIRETEPDIVFLDVQMPEVDGFEVLRRVRPSRVPALVFVTAYDAYALRAFEAEALDYLLKPFDDERFYRVLERAKARVREQRAHRLAGRLVAELGEPPGPLSAPAQAYAERIAVRQEGRVVFVRVDEVEWIEAADYCVRLHAGGRVHLIRESMRELEARLDPARFVRIHRSALVNLARIRELEPHFHGEYVVVMQDGARLRLSRGRRDHLHRLLGMTG